MTSTGLKVDANLHTQQQQHQQQQNNNNNIQLQTQPTYKNNNNHNNNHNNNQQQEQQEQDDIIDYKLDKLLPKQNQKQKLIQQNIKLKTQIYQLAVQLDQILIKDKMKRKKYGITVEDEDQAIKAKKLELKKQQLQIVQAKNRIFQLKRQLDSVFNNQVVQEQEDKLKHIKRQLEEVEDERNGLVKIKKGQAKAIKSIKNQDQFKEKIEKTHKQVMRVKQQTQRLKQKALQARKDELNCHDKYVMKKQKIRELQNKLASNAKGMKQKQKNKNGTTVANVNQNNKDMISNQLITELQEQIKKLQIEKKEGQKMWQDKIRTIQIQLQFKRAQQEKKLLILRQKQKQLKLNEIRIRQLRKMIKQNIIQQNTKKTQDMDMSQFRHKRNIRYIDK